MILKHYINRFLPLIQRKPVKLRRFASSFGSETTSSPLLSKLVKLVENDVDQAKVTLIANLFARAAPKSTLLQGRLMILDNLIKREKLEDAIAFMEQTRGHGLDLARSDLLLMLQGMIDAEKWQQLEEMARQVLYEEPLSEQDQKEVRRLIHPVMDQVSKDFLQLEADKMETTPLIQAQRGDWKYFKITPDSTPQDLALYLIAHVNGDNVDGALQEFTKFPKDLQHTGMINVFLEALAKKKSPFDQVNQVLDKMKECDLSADEHTFHHVIERLKFDRNSDGSLAKGASDTISELFTRLDSETDLSKAHDLVAHLLEAISNSSPDSVSKTWKQLHDYNYRPVSKSYNHYLQALLKTDKIDEALETLTTTLPKLAIPPTIEQIGLLVLYLQQKDPSKVEEFLKKMDEIQPDSSKQVLSVLDMLKN